MDIGSQARDRLVADGLISHPVTGLHVVDDDAGDEIVEVTVIEDASDVDVSRVVDSLRAIPHRVVRRAIRFGVRYE